MSGASEKILVFRDFSASYYYESGKEPYGYFTNFFSWYSESERLRNTFIGDLESYDGSYLIVSKREWNNFNDKHTKSWRDDYFQIIDSKFKINSSNKEDYILSKK